MASDDGREVFERCGQLEWERTTSSAYGQVEHTIIMHYLEKYLPPGGIILDAGGGQGRYAIELARRGYQVMLLDPSPAKLDIARREVARLPAEAKARVRDIVEGSIEDLSRFESGMFDGLLCLGGTLSHLNDPEARERGAAELARVCREGASLFISVLSVYGMLRKVLVEHPDEVGGLPSFLESRIGLEGMGRTDCYFFTPEELVDLLARKGIEVVEYAGAQGLSAQLKQVTEECHRDPGRWDAWREVLVRTCNHPSVVGVSDHILAVGFI